MDIKKDAAGTLIFRGQFIVSEIETAHSKIEPLFDETIHETVLDLSGVTDIDISGLQLIYAMKKSAESEGTFRIKAVSPLVREYIMLAGFDVILKEVA